MRNAIEPLDEQSSTPQAAVFPLTPNSSADKSTSLVISGIQSGWSSRYVRSCFRAFLSKLRAFNQLPVPTGNEPLLSSSHLPLKRSWDQASAAILLCIAVSFSNTGNIDHYDIGKSNIELNGEHRGLSRRHLSSVSFLSDESESLYLLLS